MVVVDGGRAPQSGELSRVGAVVGCNFVALLPRGPARAQRALRPHACVPCRKRATKLTRAMAALTMEGLAALMASGFAGVNAVLVDRFGALETRMGALETRMGVLETRMGKMEAREHNSRLSAMDTLCQVPRDDGQFPRDRGVEFPQHLAALCVAGNEITAGERHMVHYWNRSKSKALLLFYGEGDETDVDTADASEAALQSSRRRRLRVARKIGVSETQIAAAAAEQFTRDA